MTMTLVAPREGPVAVGIPTSGLIVLAGDPKTGKTWLGTSFPGSYTIELEENGADRVPWPGVRIHDIRDVYDEEGNLVQKALDAYGDVLQLVVSEPSIRTIVIDSVDKLALLMQQDIADKNGVEFLGKAVKGVDNRTLWQEFAANVKGMTDYLKASGKLVILIAHSKPPEKDDQGRVVVPAGMNVSGKGGDYIAAQAEAIGYVKVQKVNGKNVHYLTFDSSSELGIWRSRLDELQNQSVILDKANPYASFASLFNKPKAAPAPTPALKPAASTNGKTPAKAAAKRSR